MSIQFQEKPYSPISMADNYLPSQYLHDFQHYRSRHVAQTSTRPSRLNPDSIGEFLARLTIGSAGAPINDDNNLRSAVENYQFPQYVDGDSLMFRRSQSVWSGQIGLHMQYQEFPYYGGHQNLDAFSANRNLNSIACYDLGNGDNISGKNIGAAAVNPPNYGIPANFSHQSRVLESSSSSLIPDLHQMYSSLEKARSKILMVAMDSSGYRFLEWKLGRGNPHDIQIIFDELMDSVFELMVDRFGNHPIQKLFQVCTEQQMWMLILKLLRSVKKFLSVCMDPLGNRAVQRLFSNLKNTEQRSIVTSVLSCNAIALTENGNSNHVIEHFMKYSTDLDKELFVIEVARNCKCIATSKIGCSIIQKIVEYASGESQEFLMAMIATHAYPLSLDEYGNYVVQYLLGLMKTHVSSKIVSQLAGKFVELSQNKFASNVVEKCLIRTDPHISKQIIQELLSTSDLLYVIQSPYGNFVAQTALLVAKGTIKEALIGFIINCHDSLRRHPYGKRVLNKVKLL